MDPMDSAMILVVDDEPAIRESLVYALKRDGFSAEEAASLKEARAAAERGATLIILDLMLPDGNGLDFLKELRGTGGVPVIVLTSRDDETDRVVGLELGADDYVTKPFSPREVVARVRAVLRRVHPPSPPDESDQTSGPHGLSVNLDARRAYFKDAELSLSKTELDLLATLLRAPGRVFERAQLLSQVWGDDCAVLDRTVDVHLKSLRNKLKNAGGDPSVIEAVRGVGYRLRETEG